MKIAITVQRLDLPIILSIPDKFRTLNDYVKSLRDREYLQISDKEFIKTDKIVSIEQV